MGPLMTYRPKCSEVILGAILGSHRCFSSWSAAEWPPYPFLLLLDALATFILSLPLLDGKY